MSTSDETHAIPVDRGFEDEGYGHSSNSSYLSSLPTEIYRGVDENGRIYASYGKNMQGMPIDKQEQYRNDIQHAKFNLLLDDKLHLAPINQSPQNILDLGTGTGIWAIEMADRYPSARVIGVDIAPVQPTCVPPNCQFEIEDIENDWLFEKNSFDFIFGRELLLSITDWPRLIRQAYDHLKPGGYLELCMTDFRTCCADGSLDLKTSYFAESANLLWEIGERMGTAPDAQEKWRDQLMEAGFNQVHEHIFQIPSGAWYERTI
jgi:ubiquinone/menaquinone biosynthesis C-methylase UbiE